MRSITASISASEAVAFITIIMVFAYLVWSSKRVRGWCTRGRDARPVEAALGPEALGWRMSRLGQPAERLCKSPGAIPEGEDGSVGGPARGEGAAGGAGGRHLVGTLKQLAQRREEAVVLVGGADRHPQRALPAERR